MKILLTGKYGSEHSKSGPICFARLYYAEMLNRNIDFSFYEFFFSEYDGAGIINRLIGKESVLDSPKLYRIGILRLIFEFISGRFDVVHIVNNQRFIFPVLLLKPLFRTKVIYSVHGLVKKEIRVTLKNIFKKSVYIMNDFIACKFADEIVYPSELLQKSFNESYHIKGVQRVIPLAPDKMFTTNYKSAKSFDRLNYVFYSDADDEMERGTEYITKIFSSGELKKSHLYMITGKKRAANNQYITTVFPMNKQQLADFLTDKHFVIKAATFDSFSMFTAECMSAGLVPIISENTGIKDHITNGVNGIVYQSFSYDSLLSVLKKIEYGSFDYQALSKAASDISSVLNWQNTVDKYIQIYYGDTGD